MESLVRPSIENRFGPGVAHAWSCGRCCHVTVRCHLGTWSALRAGVTQSAWRGMHLVCSPIALKAFLPESDCKEFLLKIFCGIRLLIIISSSSSYHHHHHHHHHHDLIIIIISPSSSSSSSHHDHHHLSPLSLLLFFSYL